MTAFACPGLAQLYIMESIGMVQCIALQGSTCRLGFVQHSVTVMVAVPVAGGASGAADGEGSCAK